MGFLDNLFSNYSDLKKYGISEAQAKELDMLDGSEDKKLYGKSIFTEIAQNLWMTWSGGGEECLAYLKNLFLGLMLSFSFSF